MAQSVDTMSDFIQLSIHFFAHSFFVSSNTFTRCQVETFINFCRESLGGDEEIVTRTVVRFFGKVTHNRTVFETVFTLVVFLKNFFVV